MKIHIVQKEDTLWKIARKNNVDFDKLKKMNTQLSHPDKLTPGMKIKVPTAAVPVKKEKPKATPLREAQPDAPAMDASSYMEMPDHNVHLPMQENPSLPNASWSFHYPNEQPNHFSSMYEMPQNDEFNYEMNQQPMNHPGDYPQNDMPYPTGPTPEQMANWTNPMPSGMQSSHQMPMQNYMPPMVNEPNMMEMPYNDCGCGQNQYPPMENWGPHPQANMVEHQGWPEQQPMQLYYGGSNPYWEPNNAGGYGMPMSMPPNVENHSDNKSDD